MQGRNLDLLDVVGFAEVAREDLAFIQNDSAKEYFSCCLEYAVEMVFLIYIMQSVPWIVALEQHRANAEFDTPFNY